MTYLPHNLLKRRTLLRGLAAAPCAQLAWAQPNTNAAKPIVLGQIVDASQDQQDITKDFVVGARAAVMELNQSGGIKARQLSLNVVETDGSEAAVTRALAQLTADPRTAGLLGSVSDGVAGTVNARLGNGSGLCHCAPWLMSDSAQLTGSFDVFASRSAQLHFALKALSVMQLKQAAVVFAREADARTQSESLANALRQFGLSGSVKIAANDWRATAAWLAANQSPIVVMVGGTPELIALAQAMGPQTRHRFIVGLADVNMQAIAELGLPKGISLVGTQVVPALNAGVPLVRTFRSALQRYFDEPPTAQSLAGYLSARTTIDLLKAADLKDVRGSLADAAARRDRFELDGFPIARRSDKGLQPFVTQVMLGAQSRLVG